MKHHIKKLPPVIVRGDDDEGPDHDDYGAESWP